MKQTLLLVRHGQTAWNVENRLPGHLKGVLLNDTGRDQARRLGQVLQTVPISAVVSSTLERALNTAEYLVEGRDLPIDTDPDLMDTEFGSWDGMTVAEVNRNNPHWQEYVENPLLKLEGIETFLQVQQRTVAAVERWLAQEDRGPYPMVVAHADVIKVILAHYMGLDVRDARRIAVANASVSVVLLEEKQTPVVLAINWTPQPGWLKLPFIDKNHKDQSSVELVADPVSPAQLMSDKL